MSIIATTQRKLLDTLAMITKEERALVGHPGERDAILASISSLEKVRTQLELEYAQAANAIGADVCSYRIFSPDGAVGIMPLASAISSFQVLISVVYDAVHQGRPKQNTRLSAAAAAESELTFGYAFSGSTGFVLTVPNERLLVDFASDLDVAIESIFAMAKPTKPEDIAEYVARLGHGSVHALRSWAVAHSGARLGADISWRRGNNPRMHMLIEFPELTYLSDTIDATSAPTRENVEVIGELLMANVSSRTFRIRPEDGPPIVGSFEDAISESHTVELPRLYKAYLTKTTEVNYATGEETVEHFLRRIEPA